jgi:8-oxo-dGTP pyrophosphatase MutT (NUDIX family)
MTKPGAARPAWVDELVDAVAGAPAPHLDHGGPPPACARYSAVLVLLGALAKPSVSAGGVPPADILLTERATTLRSHAGQVAFPGGRVDDGDAGPAAAALREAEEETGLDPRAVEILAELPALFLPVSGNAVTPVLAWWRRPCPVRPVDPAEVAAVARVPVSELVDPRNRFRAVHRGGFTGPGFRARGLFVWGFTAGLLDWLFTRCGWERPWDTGRVLDVPVPAGPLPDGRTAL